MKKTQPDRTHPHRPQPGAHPSAGRIRQGSDSTFSVQAAPGDNQSGKACWLVENDEANGSPGTYGDRRRKQRRAQHDRLRVGRDARRGGRWGWSPGGHRNDGRMGCGFAPPTTARRCVVAARRTLTHERRNQRGLREPRPTANQRLLQLTDHAIGRMRKRHIEPNAVRAALAHGRVRYVRGAVHFVIGRKEVRHAKRSGVDLSRHDGTWVVRSRDGTIVTVYRNRDLRGLRPRQRRRRPGSEHSPRGPRFRSRCDAVRRSGGDELIEVAQVVGPGRRNVA